MLTFVKDFSLQSIKKKLILLYLFNLTDIFFTLSLLKTGYFEEMNIIMAQIVKNPLAGFAIKLFLPAILLIFLFYRLQTAERNQLKTANILLNVVLVIYFLINVSHLAWCILLFAYL